MAKKKRKVETPVAPDPSAHKFEVGDEIVVQRPNILWSGFSGTVVEILGNLYRVAIPAANGHVFHIHAPASELKLDL